MVEKTTTLDENNRYRWNVTYAKGFSGQTTIDAYSLEVSGGALVFLKKQDGELIPDYCIASQAWVLVDKII